MKIHSHFFSGLFNGWFIAEMPNLLFKTYIYKNRTMI